MVDNELLDTLIYLFYGLAFYFLGISIAVKRLKASRLKLARSLPLLAAFGFLHGSNEWLTLYVFLHGKILSEFAIYMMRLMMNFLVLASFYFLLMFGISLGISRWRRAAGWTSTAAFFGCLVFIWSSRHGMDQNTFMLMELLIRNFFGLMGGVITSYAFISYSVEIRSLSRSASRSIFYAGVIFAVYGVIAGLVPSGFVLPVLLLQIELFRGLAAVAITIFIINALNIFDIESRGKIEAKLKHLSQADKLASLGKFAAGVAHEINNPLANASIGIQMLRPMIMRNPSLDNAEKILSKLDSVERSIDRAAHIASGVLRFSRQDDAEFVKLDLNDLVEDALSNLQYKLDGIRVHKQLSSLREVDGNREKLVQALIDILDNSIEAMPGGGEIQVRTLETGGKASVVISDTGQGIPEAQLSKVFDPFFTTKAVGEGTGLGLSICHGIISQHDGSIELVSTEGKGTTVIFTIPVPV